MRISWGRPALYRAVCYELLLPDQLWPTHDSQEVIHRQTAAIYARVSSDQQKENHTIRSQTAALIAYAKTHGYAVPSRWQFQDEGYSGATLMRPGPEAVRDLAAAGQIAAVLGYSPDQLSRKYAYQVSLAEEFSRAGVDLVFLKSPSAATAEDQLLLPFQGMIAEYERAQIAPSVLVVANGIVPSKDRSICFPELLTATATARKVKLQLRITRSWKQRRKLCARSSSGTRAQGSALVPSPVSSTNVASRPAPAAGVGSDRPCGGYSATQPILAEPASEKRECDCASASHGPSDDAAARLPATRLTMIAPARTGSRFLSRRWSRKKPLLWPKSNCKRTSTSPAAVPSGPSAKRR